MVRCDGAKKRRPHVDFGARAARWGPSGRDARSTEAAPLRSVVWPSERGRDGTRSSHCISGRGPTQRRCGDECRARLCTARGPSRGGGRLAGGRSAVRALLGARSPRLRSPARPRPSPPRVPFPAGLPRPPAPITPTRAARRFGAKPGAADRGRTNAAPPRPCAAVCARADLFCCPCRLEWPDVCGFLVALGHRVVGRSPARLFAMPLYELFCMVRPGLETGVVANIMRTAGRTVLSSGGVLTDVKSFGEQPTAYPIRRPGEKYEEVRGAGVALSVRSRSGSTPPQSCGNVRARRRLLRREVCADVQLTRLRPHSRLRRRICGR